MRPIAAVLYRAATVLLAACLVAQVFLAGLGVFDDPQAFLSHRDLGYLIGMMALVLIPLAAVAGVGRAQVGLAALVWTLVIVQSILVAVREDYPAIAALHPVNGFAILAITIAMVRAARSRRQPTEVALPA